MNTSTAQSMHANSPFSFMNGLLYGFQESGPHGNVSVILIPPIHGLMLIKTCLALACNNTDWYACHHCPLYLILNHVTELLVIIKFSAGQFDQPFPTIVKRAWALGGSLLVLYPFVKVGPLRHGSSTF
jgi:hypothetical protein